MYEDLDAFQIAIQHFSDRLELVSAMVTSKKMDAEVAYKYIKSEYKTLKKVRKHTRASS